MAVLLHDRSEAAGQKQREALRLPRTSAVVALFAFSSRMDRDSMRLFARTHGDEVRAAAIASTGQEVLELLHGGLRPQVLVLDALLTKPSVTQVLQEISAMQPDPEPAVLVLVPVPEETAARKALGLFAQYRIMLRPYGMKNLFDEIYRMGTTDDEHRLYHLRRHTERLPLCRADAALRAVRGAPAEDRRFAAVCRVGGEHRDRHCDLGAEPDVGGYVQARCGAVPRTLPALWPPGKRRALQRAAV